MAVKTGGNSFVAVDCLTGRPGEYGRESGAFIRHYSGNHAGLPDSGAGMAGNTSRGQGKEVFTYPGRGREEGLNTGHGSEEVPYPDHGSEESLNTGHGSEESLNTDRGMEEVPYIGRGLVDLQINGVNGVDFNSPSLGLEGLISAAGYLLGRGVTTFFPTVITNSARNICTILSVIDGACRESELLSRCIGGIHLEGPFISPVDGYRGAHMKRYVRAPDWELFCSFQEASGGRIKIISLSPEWDNATGFIRRCKKDGLLVGIAHSGADARQVGDAVKAGARLASHLGNAVPLMLPRHPNIIWELLADERLYASIVADGFHLPDSVIRVIHKTKGKKTILVSDATCFAGLSPGVYEAHIGGDVVLGGDGSLRMTKNRGMLAGSAKLLIDNVQHLVAGGLAGISRAWHMASAGPERLLNMESHDGYSGERDRVVFNLKNGKIVINEVYKDEKPVRH